MASETELQALRDTSDETLLDQVSLHATKIMIGAAVVGLIAAFLPAVTVALSILGKTATESLAVWRDWRGKFDVLAYISVGVMAALMLRNMANPKKLAIACVIASGGAVLLALWLPLSIRGGGDVKELAEISIGIGCYLNILTSIVLAAGAVLQAKRVNAF
ncbi:unnamed protein product [Gemmata massiliana]|uniref:Uncharacterized protein n=1 Tax=Gemmata massiliana TaxID=1210884 RepID=A0A6P2CU95_9BACT|nr:hypothetical protein [Gemmata massiliana]VTR92539.1 unnamed protein product [Gemmata massiliana]